MAVIVNSGSFRDPSGFIYTKNSVLYRQVNKYYSADFDALQQSGLLSVLQARGDLVNHKDVDIGRYAVTSEAYRVIQPEPISFISYPFEWAFSQLKDAALLTLEIQQEALAHGMVLKDASAYNVQYSKSMPIFIDTLSFERYREGEPWIAYGQFCRHFLAPLALMSYVDIGLGQLLKIHLDGVPLDLANRVLPLSASFNVGLLMHLRLHARAQNSDVKKGSSHQKHRLNETSSGKISKTGLLGIIENLKKTVNNLQWKPTGTQWADYYANTNYSDTSFQGKKLIVENVVKAKQPKTVWDIGANDGAFSRIASQHGAQVLSFDIDPAAVEQNYLACKASKDTGILPLLMDFTNPTPGLGWCNVERNTLLRRGSADMVFALAIIHHFAIGNNLPFGKIADFFCSICKFLLIEFVPKTDSQVRRMLNTRRDIFTDYSEEGFLEKFRELFSVEMRIPVVDSERVVFLMRKKAASAP